MHKLLGVLTCFAFYKNDLCSSELDSLLPKIGSKLNDKEKFEPQDHARAFGSKLIKSTSAHMDDKDRLFLKLSAHPSSILSYVLD